MLPEMLDHLCLGLVHVVTARTLMDFYYLSRHMLCIWRIVGLKYECYGKLLFSFVNKNICYGYSKKTVSVRLFF